MTAGTDAVPDSIDGAFSDQDVSKEAMRWNPVLKDTRSKIRTSCVRRLQRGTAAGTVAPSAARMTPARGTAFTGMRPTIEGGEDA